VSDFLPPAAIALEATGAALAEHLSIRDRGVSDVQRRFYDTFDGLLHAAGLSAVHEGGVMSIVELATGAGRAVLAATTVPRPRSTIASSPPSHTLRRRSQVGGAKPTK